MIKYSDKPLIDCTDELTGYQGKWRNLYFFEDAVRYGDAHDSEADCLDILEEMREGDGAPLCRNGKFGCAVNILDFNGEIRRVRDIKNAFPMPAGEQ